MVLVALIAGIFTLSITLTERAKSVENNLINENILLAKIASQTIKSGYLTERLPFKTLKLISDSENILSLWVVEPNGNIYFADDTKLFGQKIDQPNTDQIKIIDTKHYKTKEHAKLIIYPLKIKQRGDWWNLYLSVSLKKIIIAKRRIILSGILIFSGVIFLTAFIAFGFAHSVTKPLNKLKQGAKALGQGNWDYKIKLKTGDEIEQLGNTFNKMAKNLKIRHLELENERNKTESIVVNLPTGLVMYDQNNKIILMNPAAEKILKINQEKVINKIINQEKTKQNHNLKNIYKIIQTKIKNKPVELEFYKPQHSFIKVSAIKIQKKNKNHFNIVKILNDITKQKELDKLKSEFVSIASHQLRTPLSIIKWNLKMSMDQELGKLSKKQKEILKKTYQSNERMISLVNNLLDVSRIEEGKIDYKFKKINIIEVLENLIQQHQVLIKEKKIKLKKDFKKKKAIFIKADKDKIALALGNIIDNAIKYTPANGQITIILKKQAKKIKISIKDTGIGMNQEEQEKLFTKFFRSTSAKRTQTQGSGLGLFISKNIIEQNKGKIKASSKPGKGTKFTCVFPII